MPPKPQEPGRPLIFCHSSRNIATRLPDTLSAALASASPYYPQLRRPLRLMINSPDINNLYAMLLNVVEATEREASDYKLRLEQEIGLDSDESGHGWSGDERNGFNEHGETSRKRRKLGSDRRSSEAVRKLLTIDTRIKIGKFEGEMLVTARRTSKASRLLAAVAV